MNCEENNIHASLSEQSDTNMSVNEACVVPYQKIQKTRGNKSLEATCSLLTAIAGLLKASQVNNS